MDKARNKFASLIEAFGQVKDPRIDRSKRHPLIEILFLTVSAVISGIEGWEEIEDRSNKETG
jgi:hypothetical protein